MSNFQPTDRWHVTTDHALHVEETGGCWVEISRTLYVPSIDRGAVQLDCAFYGPVQAFA